MVFHKVKEESLLNIVNGFLIAGSFAVFRIAYYHFMIFGIICHHVLYRAASFWNIFYINPRDQKLA
jgi:hypothetical protein